jgi:S-(hydroxymethyl)glutathione dehydrogenase/alcohol dehydrogenase
MHEQVFKAAILEKSSKPLIIDDVQLPGELLAGQVLVRMIYSGICGAQLNEIDAAKGPDKFLPHMLGHEGYGEVLEIGPLVKHVAVGNKVVLHWMPGAGIQSDPAKYLWRNKVLNAGWVTTFSEMTIVSENRCTPIKSSLDPKYLPLLGCAATTAVGVIGRDANLRLGESVVVIGTGGVGLLTIQAARASGGYPIIGVDRISERLKFAEQLGAHFVFNSTGQDILEKIKSALDGKMPDVVIETSGNRSMIELAYQLVMHGGRCVLVGVPRHDDPASIDTLPLHFDTVFIGSKGGGTRPEVDILRIARLAEAGLFQLDSLPVQLFSLDGINDAIKMVRDGLPGRAVVDMSCE